MEKIDTSKLSGNQTEDGTEPKHYEDIEILVNKINEIVEFLSNPKTI